MAEHPLDLLPFYASGHLASDEQRALESHLAECESCRAALAEWKALSEAVQKRAARRAASLPPLRLPVETVKGEKSMSTTVLYPRRALPQRVLAAVAAVFALALLIALFPPRVIETPLVNTQTERRTIYDILKGDPQFSALVKAVDADDWLKSVLQGEGPLTFFAMPDKVFKPVLLWVSGRKQAGEPDWTQEVIFDHLLRGAWSSADLVRLGQVSSDWVQGAAGYVTIITASRTSVQSEIILNGRAHFVTADIPASNGLIHIVDHTLVPDDILSPPSWAGVDGPSIYDFLKQDGRFMLFTSLMDADSSSQSILKSVKRMNERTLWPSIVTNTMFVPTDDAMRIWLNGRKLTDLRADAADRFIFAHLIQGLWSKDMLEGRVDQNGPQVRIATSTGISILLTLDADGLLLNDGARIVQPDIITSNGIIHVIDKVLVSKEFPD